MILSNVSRQTLSRISTMSSMMPKRQQLSLLSTISHQQQQQQQQKRSISLLNTHLHRPTLSPTTVRVVQPQPQQSILTCERMIIKRSFSLWRIPFYWATATKAKRQLAVLGSVTGLTAIGALIGPTFWLALGGIGTIVSWRIYQQTKRWWQLMNPAEQLLSSFARNSGGEGLFQLLRRQVGSHQAAEQVQQRAIDKLTQWAHTDIGRKVIVDDLNVGHVDDMTFYPPHSCSMTTESITINGQKSTGQKVHVEFWAEANQKIHPRSGSCCVYVDAVADASSGDIQIKDIRLAAPGWAADEHVPLNDLNTRKNVIEGEYKDVV